MVLLAKGVDLLNMVYRPKFVRFASRELAVANCWLTGVTAMDGAPVSN